MNKLKLKFIFIILSLCPAFAIFELFLKPNILIPSCLLETQNCSKITYRKYKNSALVNVVKPSFGFFLKMIKYFYMVKIQDKNVKVTMFPLSYLT